MQTSRSKPKEKLSVDLFNKVCVNPDIRLAQGEQAVSEVFK